MIVCGIDPGLKGGMSFYSVIDKTIDEMDMPLGVKGSAGIDVVQLHFLLSHAKPDLVVIELPFALARQSMAGTQTSFTNFGRMLGVIELLGLRYRLVKPLEWKGKIGATKDKRSVLPFIRQTIPDYSLPKTKRGIFLDGRSDATALAIYGSIYQVA